MAQQTAFPSARLSEDELWLARKEIVKFNKKREKLGEKLMKKVHRLITVYTMKEKSMRDNNHDELIKEFMIKQNERMVVEI
jgi:hypothetical protein